MAKKTIRMGRKVKTVPTPWIKPFDTRAYSQAGAPPRVIAASESSAPSTPPDSQLARGVATV